MELSSILCCRGQGEDTLLRSARLCGEDTLLRRADSWRGDPIGRTRKGATMPEARVNGVRLVYEISEFLRKH